jgi:hypothetical protein
MLRFVRGMGMALVVGALSGCGSATQGWRMTVVPMLNTGRF